MEKCPKCGARMFPWRRRLVDIYKRNAKRRVFKCPNCRYETNTD